MEGLAQQLREGKITFDEYMKKLEDWLAELERPDFSDTRQFARPSRTIQVESLLDDLPAKLATGL